MINRPDRPIPPGEKDRDRQAMLRERGEGAHAEQDSLTEPDAVAGPPHTRTRGDDPTTADPGGDRVGATATVHPRTPPPGPAYDVTEPDEFRDVLDTPGHGDPADPDAIDLTDPADVREVADPDDIRDTTDPDGERIVPDPDENGAVRP